MLEIHFYFRSHCHLKCNSNFSGKYCWRSARPVLLNSRDPIRVAKATGKELLTMKGRESTRKNGNRERKAPSRLKKIDKKIHTVRNSEECEKGKRMVLRKMRGRITWM